MNFHIHHGDVLEALRQMPDGSIHCCVTSPPYWGLRDYGIPPSIWGGDPSHNHRFGDEIAFCDCGAWLGCLGLEPTPELFVQHVVEVFREVKRVLRDDGTLWLNLGDSYASTPPGVKGVSNSSGLNGAKGDTTYRRTLEQSVGTRRNTIAPGLKPKDLVGIPWRVAFALQADGWYLRSDIIWHKKSPMPESVTDRPTKSHEYIFLLSKQERYFYDAEAIKEPTAADTEARYARGRSDDHKYADGGPGDQTIAHSFKHMLPGNKTHKGTNAYESTRNKRSVWSISTSPTPEAHFATYPIEIPETCLLAGTSAHGVCASCGSPWRRIKATRFKPQEDVSEEKGVRGNGEQKPMDQSNTWQGFPRGTTQVETLGWEPTCKCGAEIVAPTVLDPFSGAGTTGLACLKNGRQFVGIELNQQYIDIADARARKHYPLLLNSKA